MEWDLLWNVEEIKSNLLFQVNYCRFTESSHVVDVLSRLSQVIVLPNSRDEVYKLATDNAIAAVGKLIKFQA